MLSKNILFALGGLLGVAAVTTAVVVPVVLNSKVETEDVEVIHETKFNSSYVNLTNDDMKELGFSFGDSCDVYYSNGKSFEDIPYFDGYYTRSDFPLICGYQGYPYVQVTINNSSDYWDRLELSEGMTCKIVLNTKAKYINEQEAFSMKYSTDRTKFTSDEEFANFRMMSGGDLKENVLYRGASPFNNTYNRSSYVDNLLKNNSVTYIMDLADKEEDMAGYNLTNSYANMQNKSLLNMGSNFRDQKYMESIARGLTDLLNYKGKCYIHCTEGKDRTGFVCALLEGLCNATYDEMVNDYMITYKNYFDITKNDAKYDAVVNLRFDEFLEYLTGEKDINVIKTMNYSKYCKDYLLAGNMSEENIDKLVDYLTK